MIIHRKINDFFVRFNISLDALSSLLFTDMITEINSAISLASKEAFEEEILPSLYDMYRNEVLAEKYHSILCANCSRAETQLSFITTAITLKSSSVYVCESFLKLENQNDDSIKNWCYDYFNSSVKKAKDILNLDVHTVIFDCDINVDYDPKFLTFEEKFKYFRLRCLSLLLKELRLLLPATENREQDNEIEIIIFSSLQDFYDNLEKADSLGEATQLMLQFVSLNKSNDHTFVNDQIIAYKGPLHMACLYYNPKFKAKIVDTENLKDFQRDLNRYIYLFNLYDLPADFNTEHSHYFHESHQFITLFDVFSENPIEFWIAAKSTCPNLSPFALGLLRVPTFLKKFDWDDVMEFGV